MIIRGKNVMAFGHALPLGNPLALFRMSANLRMRSIMINGAPYMERYALHVEEERQVYAYLHRFIKGDGDRFLHSHPWPVADSIILSGGYHEDRYNAAIGAIEKFHYVEGDANQLSADQLHQITETAPETWTLFYHGPWTENWGFVDGWENGRPIIRRDHPRGKNRGWWNTFPMGRDHPDRQPMFGMED